MTSLAAWLAGVRPQNLHLLILLPGTIGPMPRGFLITCFLMALLLQTIVGTASAKLLGAPLYANVHPGMTPGCGG